jgi:hypothetical protein
VREFGAVIALSVALVILGGLAYAAWRDWLTLRVVVPPHEALKAEVESIRSDLDTVMAWAGAKRGSSDG